MNTTSYKIAAIQLAALATLGTGALASAAQAPAPPASAGAGTTRTMPVAGAPSPATTPPGAAGPQAVTEGAPSAPRVAPATGEAPGVRLPATKHEAPRARVPPARHAAPRVRHRARTTKPEGVSRRRGRSAARRAARARAAQSSSVTIRDFSFGPAAITVHAGDTVTWINEGTANHTATSAGSFDTGVLHTGQSASQTFTRPGSFSYRCSIHPFMRGVVTVLPAPSSSGAKQGPGSGAASGTEASGTQPPAAAPSGPSLPATGLDTRRELVAGVAMLALGGALLTAAGAMRRSRGGGAATARGRRSPRRGPPTLR